MYALVKNQAKVLQPYQIIESIRTGKIAIERELGINTESLKNN